MKQVDCLESRRFFSAGSIDPSFGGGDGSVEVRTNKHTWTVAYNDADVDDQGRSVLASVYPAKQQITVTRLLSDGTLDTSFGKRGIATLSTGYNKKARGPFQITVDHAGKTLILFKNRLTRLAESGGADSSFGSGGSILMSGFSAFGDLAADSSNRPVVIGTSQGKTGNRGTVVRYNARGELDSSFGSSGFFKTPVPLRAGSGTPGDATGHALKVLADGSVICVTRIGVRESDLTGGESGISAFRLTATGTLDTRYGTQGYKRQTMYFSEYTSASTRFEAFYDDGSLLVADLYNDTASHYLTKTWTRIDTSGRANGVAMEGLVDDPDRDDDVTIFPTYYTDVVSITPDNKLLVRYDQSLIRFNANYSRDTTFTQATLPIRYAPASLLAPLPTNDRLLTFSVVFVGDQRMNSTTRVTAIEL